MLILTVFTSLVMVFRVSADFTARAWQAAGKYPDVTDFPEVSLLSDRPNTAIAFSGGGSRSFLAGMGYLAALHKLDLMKNVRYLGGISGGGWLTSTYTWAQNVTDDETFLGPIINPEDFTTDLLSQMDPACARGVTDRVAILEMLKAYRAGLAETFGESYIPAISSIYLEPVNVPRNKFFTWNEKTLEDILLRNSQLSTDNFTLVVRDRPFPVIGMTVIGPFDGVPYTGRNNFTRLEMTPIYVGEMRQLDVEYEYLHGKVHTKRVGGLVEAFAFNKHGAGPASGLPAGSSTGLLQVPEPTTIADIATFAAVNGWAPGTFTDLLRPKELANEFSIHFDYWSPTQSEKPDVTDFIFSDGGTYEDLPLISFLQRRVDRVILFVNDAKPLYPADRYNPYTDVYTGEEASLNIAAYFGVFPSPPEKFTDLVTEYSKNQVFPTENYANVISSLQAAQKAGKGIIGTFNLTTIENDWWGVPAGIETQITFVHIGRLTSWEDRLPSDMKSHFVPENNPEDLTNLVDDPDYFHFPHYLITGGNQDAKAANALSSLTGWTIMENAETFRQLLQA